MKQTASLIFVILLISWSLYSAERRHERNLLEEIRDWTISESLWPELQNSQLKSLIGVREVYSIEQAQLRLKAYLLLPCESLCGDTEGCARHCQSLMTEWEGESSKARLMIEGYDLKHRRSLGRLLLDHVAPVELRYWSRKHAIISLIQTSSTGHKELILLQLTPQKEAEALVNSQDTNKVDKRRADTTQAFKLTHYDTLALGSSHGQESPLEGSVSFRDLDGDDQIDLIAPLERLVHLKPLQLYVPTPYRLSANGLMLASDLINVTTPSHHQLREWLIAVRGDNSTQPNLKRAKRLFSFGVLLYLKGESENASRLIRLAYPQYPPILHLWDQLITHLGAQNQAEGQDHKQKRKRQDPFSVLDH